MGVSFQLDFGSKEKAGHLLQIILIQKKGTIKELNYYYLKFRRQ